MNGVDHDPVNHPSHYTSHPSGIECLEITRATNIPNVSNAIKYVWRTDLKDDTLEDLHKAEFYLLDQIEHFGPKAELPWDVRDKLLKVRDFETDPARREFFRAIAWGFLPGACHALAKIITTHTTPEETDV